MPAVSDSHKAERKNKILDYALLCFAEKGYHETKIDDIVVKSGISKGSIYNYFKSKEEIYNAILSDKSSSRYLSFKEHIDTLRTATEKLNYFFEFYGNQLKE